MIDKVYVTLLYVPMPSPDGTFSVTLGLITTVFTLNFYRYKSCGLVVLKFYKSFDYFTNSHNTLSPVSCTANLLGGSRGIPPPNFFWEIRCKILHSGNKSNTFNSREILHLLCAFFHGLNILIVMSYHHQRHKERNNFLKIYKPRQASKEQH